MPDYNFQSLNDREFEKLSRDLLQRETGLTFESFKPGRDGGIDLRHISPIDHEEIIVQAKHRSRSKFNDLFSHLKREELPKVKKLKPGRYILTTSVELNPDQKAALQKLFKPFILTPGDILGRDDINGLLARYPDVETAHAKLWMSSVNVLRKIINNGAKGRSDFAAASIEKNISLYVPNEKYSEALDILNEERFLIILGEPGIGKTVLARMLIYQLLGADYKLVQISEKISEAEDLWDYEQKQVFYFDDFLGANYLEILQQNNADSALVNFIERVREDPTKRLILTSRTTVLNRAIQVLQRLSEPSLELGKHEVHIDDYGVWDKARILYNHLYFLGLGENYFQKVREDDNYWKIIRHKNYNPRLIEFITDPLRVKGVKPSGYIDFILESLENPAHIWRHAYLNQIDEYSRFFLQSLFSLGPNIPQETLSRAFTARLDYEIEHNGFKRETNIFTSRIQLLLGGFIKSERKLGTDVTFDFFNPSIVDFLLNFLNENPEEKWRILESIKFTSQLSTRFSKGIEGYIEMTAKELPRLYKIVKAKEGALEDHVGGSAPLELLKFYYETFPEDVVKDDLQRILKGIDLQSIATTQTRKFRTLVRDFAYEDGLRELILERWNEIINWLFDHAYEQEELDAIMDLFEEYGEDYEKYIAQPGNADVVKDSLDNYWRNRIDNILWGNEEVADLYKPDDVKDFIDDVRNNGDAFNRRFGVEALSVMDRLDDADVENIAETNEERARGEDYAADAYKDEMRYERNQEREAERAVNELFE